MTEPFESEGDEVVSYTAQLPSATLEAEQEYPRGTIINLNVQVRVIGFTENEDKKGNLIHKHNLALEEVSIIDFLTPAQRRALIEAAEREAEEQERLAAGATIPEEEHIEDVIPGQTTVEEQIAEALAEIDDNTDDDSYSPFDRNDPRNHITDEDSKFLNGLQDKLDEHRRPTAQLDDDDDHEHDWMDEEEDYAHGLRVEVGF